LSSSPFIIRLASVIRAALARAEASPAMRSISAAPVRMAPMGVRRSWPMAARKALTGWPWRSASRPLPLGVDPGGALGLIGLVHAAPGRDAVGDEDHHRDGDRRDESRLGPVGDHEEGHHRHIDAVRGDGDDQHLGRTRRVDHAVDGARRQHDGGADPAHRAAEHPQGDRQAAETGGVQEQHQAADDGAQPTHLLRLARVDRGEDDQIQKSGPRNS
jgi:hypothetical protein